jgi:hypothetical protein
LTGKISQTPGVLSKSSILPQKPSKEDRLALHGSLKRLRRRIKVDPANVEANDIDDPFDNDLNLSDDSTNDATRDIEDEDNERGEGDEPVGAHTCDKGDNGRTRKTCSKRSAHDKANHSTAHKKGEADGEDEAGRQEADEVDECPKLEVWYDGLNGWLALEAVQYYLIYTTCE